MTAMIPFGKYKGQPVDVLAADRDYAEWLQQQDWFRERYQVSLYTIIINNFGEPDDSLSITPCRCGFWRRRSIRIR